MYNYDVQSVNSVLIIKAIKDWHLAIFVIVALLIDVILLGILTAFRGGRTQASLVRNYENPSDETGVSWHMHACIDS